MPSTQGKAEKGSRKWLQILVNDRQDLLDQKIFRQSPLTAEYVRWLSPLRADNYREYYDRPFIDLLRIKLDKRDLGSFWPSSGPRWDALAKTDNGKILLVEAKSHTKELISSLGAKNQRSLSQIRASIAETKGSVGSRSESSVDWTVGVYQYANRLAHLYLLHKLNGLEAYLVLLSFLNDNEMQARDTFVPTVKSEWESVITYQDRLMGIRQRHPLSEHIIHAFIDVKDIEANR